MGLRAGADGYWSIDDEEQVRLATRSGNDNSEDMEDMESDGKMFKAKAYH